MYVWMDGYIAAQQTSRERERELQKKKKGKEKVSQLQAGSRPTYLPTY